ncbi:TAFII55 protein conserved region-domain-containing protein [Coniella lustricola]|uniref:TAFII55 protein conserved region-domain-containing protein n=1 Tax=Coniella lustricola TaxID=2025994 RepID=A0A2T3AIN7_9PEZI|nr:TAFII55 protein conserved region-domain-containing protein [Coniella lustricola]
MEGTKKLKLKINRPPSVSSNGLPSASQAQTPSFGGQPVATPDAMSPPTSYFPPSLAMSPTRPSGAAPAAPSSATMPPPAVPPTPTEGRPKIKLKMNRSQPPTPVNENPPSRTPLPARTPLPQKVVPAAEPPAAPTPTTTKAGRTSKPTAKKRARNDAGSDSDDEVDQIQQPQNKKRPIIKTKIPIQVGGQVRKISLKDKLTSSNVVRQPGSGFDSEMEDAESDPITEEEIIFRMMEGVECDYINECLNAKHKKFPSGGNMEFKLKWVDERRAAVTVQTQMFAAVLVDLPTITEATKTWDKKLVMKAADICQMLLAFKRITREEEAKTAELPKVIFDGYRWPHGLTPPMHDAVHRRFRKRLHKNEIDNKEKEVERLLKADKAAIRTRFEFIGERRGTMQVDTPDDDMLDAEGEEDAEGEDEDYPGQESYGPGIEDSEDAALDAAALEEELLREMEDTMLADQAMDSAMNGTLDGHIGQDQAKDKDGQAAKLQILAERVTTPVPESDDEELQGLSEEEVRRVLQRRKLAAQTALNLVHHATKAGQANAETPGQNQSGGQHDEDDVQDDLFGDDFGEDESGEDDYDDDEESDEDLDPAERERREQIRGVRDELKDIGRQIADIKKQLQLPGAQNPLIRSRLQTRLKGLNEDMRLKLASIGEEPPEDSEED